MAEYIEVRKLLLIDSMEDEVVNIFEGYNTVGNPFEKLLLKNSKDVDSKSVTSVTARQNNDKHNLSAVESDEAAEAKAKARVMTSTTVNDSKFAGLYCQILESIAAR